MATNRRDFLKYSVASGLLLGTDIAPVRAASSKTLPPAAVGILYDATLCIGCKSCMVNCKKYNSVEGGALYSDGTIPYEHILPQKIYDAPQELSAKTVNIIKAYKNGTGVNKDTLKNGYSFIKMHCLHCIDPACVSVCPVAALYKDPQTGVVAYAKDRCIGCRYCQMACPFSIPKLEWELVSPQIRKCQLCRHRFADNKYSACCEFCPTGASIFGPVTDLRDEAKRRLQLTPGKYYDYPLQKVDGPYSMPKKASTYVNHIYGMNEAGGTQYMLLAGVPFDNLGFNPRITNQAYPELTWKYIIKVPVLVLALVIAGAISHIATRSKKADD